MTVDDGVLALMDWISRLVDERAAARGALRLVRAAARDLETALETGDARLVTLAAARFTTGERTRDAVEAVLARLVKEANGAD